MNKQSDIITIYTDGGCYNTGDKKGIGASAFLTPDETNNREIIVRVFRYTESTNNRTEMMAVIHAIEWAQTKGYPCCNIITDSGYIVKGYTDPSYLNKWKRNGWITSNKKPVQNIDLWQQVSKLSWHQSFTFTLIKGHNKDANVKHAYYNDICDRACTCIMQNCDTDGKHVLIYDTATELFNRMSDHEIYETKIWR